MRLHHLTAYGDQTQGGGLPQPLVHEPISQKKKTQGRCAWAHMRAQRAIGRRVRQRGLQTLQGRTAVRIEPRNAILCSGLRQDAE